MNNYTQTAADYRDNKHNNSSFFLVTENKKKVPITHKSVNNRPRINFLPLRERQHVSKTRDFRF